MRADLRELAAIFAGGFAGALARAGLVEAFPAPAGHWPWATLAANVAGALVLGWVATARPRSPYRRSLVGTGFCGALTTFSTMQLELLRMLDQDRVALAAAYALCSVVAGLLAVTLATSVTRAAPVAA